MGFTNLADLVTRHAGARSRVPSPWCSQQRVAARSPGPSSTRRIGAVAAGLAAHGLVAGHRVALCGANSIEFVVAYFAALRAGFVAVPLNPQLTDGELTRSLTDSGARVLLTDTDRGDARRRPRRSPLTDAGAAASWPTRRSATGQLTAAIGRRWPCCSTPPAPRASRRRRCSPTAPCSPTWSTWTPLGIARRRHGGAGRAAAVPRLRAERRARQLGDGWWPAGASSTASPTTSSPCSAPSR